MMGRDGQRRGQKWVGGESEKRHLSKELSDGKRNKMLKEDAYLGEHFDGQNRKARD